MTAKLTESKIEEAATGYSQVMEYIPGPEICADGLLSALQEQLSEEIRMDKMDGVDAEAKQ